MFFAKKTFQSDETDFRINFKLVEQKPYCIANTSAELKKTHKSILIQCQNGPNYGPFSV